MIINKIKYIPILMEHLQGSWQNIFWIFIFILKGLIEQFERSSSAKIKDEQILIKLEKHLNSMDVDYNIQNEELIFLNALQFFQIYKNYKRNSLKNSSEFEIFNARILQISCELLFIGYAMEQKFKLNILWFSYFLNKKKIK